MNFYRVIREFKKYLVGDILLIDGHSHWFVVKAATSHSKTEYNHSFWFGIMSNNHVNDFIRRADIAPLSVKELRKIRHHLTWRMWISDASSKCNEYNGGVGFSFDVLSDSGKKLYPLPPVMCFDCLREGNKWLPKIPPREYIGKCRVCNETKVLHKTIYGWPLKLSHKGFGNTIISTGDGYTRNIGFYNKEFDMSIYHDYKG